jgi:hypothetical protein
VPLLTASSGIASARASPATPRGAPAR